MRRLSKSAKPRSLPLFPGYPTLASAGLFLCLSGCASYSSGTDESGGGQSGARGGNSVNDHSSNGGYPNPAGGGASAYNSGGSGGNGGNGGFNGSSGGTPNSYQSSGGSSASDRSSSGGYSYSDTPGSVASPFTSSYGGSGGSGGVSGASGGQGGSGSGSVTEAGVDGASQGDATSDDATSPNPDARETR